MLYDMQNMILISYLKSTKKEKLSTSVHVYLTYMKLFTMATVPCFSFYLEFKMQNEKKQTPHVWYIRECFSHVNNVIIRFKPPLFVRN